MNIPNINHSSTKTNLEVPLLIDNKKRLSSYEKKSNYNPFNFPPDIQMAKNHSKANRVAKNKDQLNEILKVSSYF